MTTRRPKKEELHQRSSEHAIGSVVFALGILILILHGFEMANWLSGLPRFWHQNQLIWFVLGLGLVGFGCRQIWNSEQVSHWPETWKPSISGMRFRRIELYTRQNCPLCDEAEQTLIEYDLWLPMPIKIDIDTDPELRAKFDTTIPVIACDGRIRFRGRVNEVLLQRLIEGTPPLES